MPTIMQSPTHLGPTQSPDGSWKITFEPACRRPGAEHGDFVICEPFSGVALDRLKQALVLSGALGNASMSWTDRREALHFLTEQVLLSKGHRK